MTARDLPSCEPTVWENWSGTQRICPAHVSRPQSLPELRDVVRQVEARSGQLKPVAAGLSFSDILQSEDTLLETVALLGEGGCGALLPLENDLWRAPPAAPLVRIPSGARIRALNAALAQAGLGFINLGGYDMQTMVGAISTSTHGSGVTLPPLPDAVRSLDLLAAGGRAYRIEPTDGITDAGKFKRRYGDAMTLVQSDEWFWSCVVSLGCMGIITSVTMEVRPSYLLQERIRIRLWSDVRRELEHGDPLKAFRNYEVLLNPYPRKDGDYDCLVTERGIAAPQVERHTLPPSRRSAESVTFLASSQQEILKLMRSKPRLIPGMLRAGFEALETHGKPHVDHSYVVYNVGKINTVEVMSGEYFFPLAGGRYLSAIDRLLSLVLENCRRGIYQPSPLALRFVEASKAYLSMAHGERQASIEIACFTGLPFAASALLSYERSCIELGGRPHWGQVQELTGAPGWLDGAYPSAHIWRSVYGQLNQSGLFNNHFTDRLGISLP